MCVCVCVCVCMFVCVCVCSAYSAPFTIAHAQAVIEEFEAREWQKVRIVLFLWVSTLSLALFYSVSPPRC